MYKIIFNTIKSKKSIFLGTLISITLALMLTTICWNLMFSAIEAVRNNGADFIGAISLFGTLSGITVFAAVYVIVGTTSFSIQQRYENIALLKGIGLTSRQIKKMMLIEMNLMAVAGYTIGAPLGLLFGPKILEVFITMGAIPSNFSYSVTPLNMLLVFIMGWSILQLAAYISTNYIASVSPVDAFREAVVRSKRTGLFKWCAGLIFILGAVAILVFVPQTGPAGIGYNFLASLCCIIGVSILGDNIMKIISFLISGILRLFGPVGYLAFKNSGTQSYRQANAALGIVLMIALNGGILMNSLAFNEQNKEEALNYYNDHTIIVNESGFTNKQLDYFKKLFNDKDYSVLVESKVDHYGLNGNKYKYDDYDFAGVINGFSESEVSVSKKFARQFETSVGDKLKLRMLDGKEIEVIVSGIHDRADYNKADVVSSFQLVSKHDPRAVIEDIMVNKSAKSVEEALNDLKEKYPQIMINPSFINTIQQESNLRTQDAVIYTMILISLVFSIISVINTFFITIDSRKTEYRNLWLIGMTKQQVYRMLRFETMTVILAGIIVGAAINTACVGTFYLANGYGVTLVGNPIIYFGLIGIAVTIGLLAGLWSISQSVSSVVGTVKYEF